MKKCASLFMLDREEWRSRIKMKVAANKEVDYSKREDSKREGKIVKLGH
jgi:hypothetical protein